MRLRGGSARKHLPFGKFHRIKARHKRRGNKNNESLKEWFLIACGDPETSTTWLAGQIQTLEDSGYDVARQRAGARFDSMKGMPLPHIDEDEEEESEQGQAKPCPCTQQQPQPQQAQKSKQPQQPLSISVWPQDPTI